MKPSEDLLIAKIASSTKLVAHPNSRITRGIGDDAALLKPRSSHEIVLTCDWFLEGTHFLRGVHPPDSVGWKCLARALSDIAAMGGEPRCFLLSLALPEGLSHRWLTQFLRGLRRASRVFHCPLAGGDTTRKSEVAISVTAVGDVPSGRALLRSGASPGDLIFVSGYLGLAEIGLRTLRLKHKVIRPTNPALAKHLYPEPRLQLGQFLAARRLATAMMDLSDGLSTDLPRLCAASRLGARIEAAKLPGAGSTQSVAQPVPITESRLLELAVNGGDDYELLFTVAPRAARLIPASFRGIPLTRIGEITSSRRLILSDHARNEPLQSLGWDPFRGSS